MTRSWCISTNRTIRPSRPHRRVLAGKVINYDYLGLIHTHTYVQTVQYLWGGKGLSGIVKGPIAWLYVCMSVDGLEDHDHSGHHHHDADSPQEA
jgi:hypothetical protein